LLLDRPGHPVSGEQIQAVLWPGDTFVDFEQGVNHTIRELRSALGDAADSWRSTRRRRRWRPSTHSVVR
jgi:DNA-binding winged helix-turn-helix (wHTH) protein